MNKLRFRSGGLCLVTFCGVACSLAAGHARAQVQSRVVAYTGQGVDSVRVLRAFDHVVLNDDGHVLFHGSSAINTPDNDECENAIEIFPGVTSLGNDFATTDSALPWCGRLEVWYRFTPSETAQVRLSALCGGASPNLAWQLYSGDCGRPQHIFTDCSNGQTFTGTLQAGTNYFLRVGSSPAESSRQGVITFVYSVLPPSVSQRQALPVYDNFLWLNRGNGNEPILHEGDVTSFDPELSYRGLSFARVGGSDRLVLPATARGADPAEPTRVSLVTGFPSGPFEQELRDTANPPVVFSIVPVPQLTVDGDTAYTQLPGDLLRVGSRSVARAEAAPGTPAGVTFNFIDQPVVSGRAFAFRSTLSGDGVTDANNMGIWVDRNDGGGVSLVARLGSASPGTPAGTVFAALPILPGVNELGEVAISATVSGESVTPETSTGVWRGGSAISLVVRAGDSVPGIEGAVFNSFSARPVLNRRGEMVFKGSIRGEKGSGIDAGNNAGIWKHVVGSGLTLIAREGEQAPGLPKGVVFSHVNEPVLGAAGDVAFIGRLRGPGIDAANGEAIFLRTRDGTMRSVVRKGDMIAMPSGDPNLVTSIDFGSPIGAGHDTLNFSSQVAFKLGFADFTRAVLVTERACAGDWDHSGTLSSEDFFAFLTDFFVNVADFNRDGYSDSQDLFDYLNAFFEGCEE